MSREHHTGFAYGWLALLTAALLLPALLSPPLLHDSFKIDIVWTDQFTAELARGNLLPRWLPESHDGLGSPVFYFYPPLAFYVAGFFGLAGASAYPSVLAAFGVGILLSGIFCWHWLRSFCSRPLLGASFYCVAPYHVFDFIHRGALAEVTGIALLPLLALGLSQICKGKSFVLAAVAYAALILAHLPLALLTSLLLIAPYGVLARRSWPRVALAVLLGVGLAAFYLVPALALDSYRDSGLMWRYPRTQPHSWLVWAGNWHDTPFRLVYLIIASLSLCAAALLLRRRDLGAGYALAVCALVAGVAPFFWSLPLIDKIQFPFRALPLAELGIAAALGGFPAGQRRAWVYAVPPLMLSIALAFPPSTGSQADVKMLTTLHPDVVEYLPPGLVPPLGAGDNFSLDRIRSSPPAVPGMVVSTRFFFPAWSCGLPEPSTKLLMHAPDCLPTLRWTPAEIAGNWISLLAAAVLLVLAWRRNSKRSDKAAA